jgi:plasmid maintenance system antidote protein VapI
MHTDTKPIGKIIEEQFKKSKMSKTAFANSIQVHRNNVYDIFTRKSIDTDLLKRIGEALNYDFFIHYIKKETLIVNEDAPKYEKRKRIVFIPVEVEDGEYDILTSKIGK